jgi:hypothetical protein
MPADLMERDGDKLTVRFHAGQAKAWRSEKRIVAVIAGSQSGKALDVNTLIPTPDGFVRMGDLRVGGQVFDRDGTPCRITHVSPVYHGRTCYRVCFDDGTSVVADAEHLWVTRDRKQRKNMARRVTDPDPLFACRPQCKPTPDESTVTTEHIRDTLFVQSKRGPVAEHSVDCPGAFHAPNADLPIPPYTLGAWLGDGNSAGAIITTADEGVLDRIRAEGVSVGKGMAGSSGLAKQYRLGAVRVNQPWDADRRSQAVALYQSGKNVAEVAEAVGGGRGRVRKVLRSAGVVIERRPARIGHRQRSRRGAFLPGKLARPATSDTNLSLQTSLRREGLAGNKHIPDAYLFASIPQRLALLQGLMDTDGCCDGSCEFTNTNERLALGVLTLLRGLGVKARLATKTATLYGRPCGTAYRVTFTTSLPVFGLARKAERQPIRSRPDTSRRFITAVEPVPSVPVRCIAVDSPSRTYLCGEAFVPTHNSTYGPPWLHREMTRRGPGDYLIASPTFKLMALKVLPVVVRFFERMLQAGKLTGGNSPEFRFSPAGEVRVFGRRGDQPSRILFGHAADPDSLESATAKAAWLDEAGQNKFRLGSWEAVQRRLAVHQGRVLITTTPYNTGWLKQKIFDPWKASGRNHPEIDVIQFKSVMNPTFSRDEYERARRSMPGWRFRMMYDGEFERPAGMIYHAFDTATHVVPRFAIPAHWPRCQGLDFGGVHTASVWLAEEVAEPARPGEKPAKTGRLYAYREYLQGGRTAKQHAEAFRQGEPGLPAVACGGSASEQQWRDEFAAAGFPVKEPPIKDVEVGIDRVVGVIQRGELYVFDDLHRLLDELGSYSREVDEAGEPTEKIEDKNSFHACDALRYIVAYIRGEQKKVKVGAW